MPMLAKAYQHLALVKLFSNMPHNLAKLLLHPGHRNLPQDRRLRSLSVSFGPDEVNKRQGWGAAGTSDWDAFPRAYLGFSAKSDTELGTLTGCFAGEFNADNDTDVGDSLINVDEAYIQLGGLKAGFFYSWWDKGLNGETDSIGNVTEFNSIAYLYDGGAFQAGIALDELEGWSTKANGIGVQAIVSATVGGVLFELLGGYDAEVEEGAIRALISAELGPGTLQAAAIWASDPNTYWSASEWTVSAFYALKGDRQAEDHPRRAVLG
ncbi:porin [Sinorhizobium sp. 7-81]|uniref:porin n=1 Tax=Sinorhizobium sp. 8-89 TaxID=3049089 RepID=UPI0024C43172|nr:porin [Sinorhizobium sp. 8-89]MDK1494550.1 porin [Sinorhizobium sp. 8-89]